MDSVMHLNAVAFEEDGVWIVQGIEYDIATFTHDIDNIPEAFMKTVMEYVCISAELGRQPLQGIKPAPQRFRDMFERSRSRVSAVEEQVHPVARMTRPIVDIRLAAA